MYIDFYRLRGRPFRLSPDHHFFFGSRPHRRAMAYLTYGLSQREGFIVITGEIGIGKTTLIDYLLSSLDRSTLITAKIATTQLDADNLLRMAAYAFGIEDEGLDKATLLRRLESFLVAQTRAGRHLLLIVDESQNLSPSALEELRMLSNFQLDERALLQTYLIGQPQFRQILARDRFEQLRQRVIASYHLTALDAAETRSYVEHRLRHVGWQNDPSFDDHVFRLIYEHTGGVPRIINLLCERLLLSGCLEERHHIDVAMTEEVVRELHEEGSQLPSAAGSALENSMVDSPVDSLEVAKHPARLSEQGGKLQSILSVDRGAAGGEDHSETSANGAGTPTQSRMPGGPGRAEPVNEAGPNGSGNRPIGDMVAREAADLTEKAKMLDDHVRILERRLRQMLASLDE